MSVAGIASSSMYDPNTTSVQNRSQQLRKKFQQLGQDSQSGNLSAAQADFTTLQQQAPGTGSSTSGSPIAQQFNLLSQDLKSGNLSAAQQDYTSIQQAFQQQSGQVHHHRHHGGGGESNNNNVSQVLAQLGQDLQSGNLSDAQKAYTTLQQDLQSFSKDSAFTAAASTSTSSGIAASA